VKVAFMAHSYLHEPAEESYQHRLYPNGKLQTLSGACSHTRYCRRCLSLRAAFPLLHCDS
jgi:hypothetical protein